MSGNPESNEMDANYFGQEAEGMDGSGVDDGMGGESEEEEDEYYENPVDLIQEFGTHPLMEKAQQALEADSDDQGDGAQQQEQE